MQITIHCPSCRKSYPVHESALGRRVACAQCGNEFVVERDAAEQPAAAAPATGPPAGSLPVAKAVPRVTPRSDLSREALPRAVAMSASLPDTSSMESLFDESLFPAAEMPLGGASPLGGQSPLTMRPRRHNPNWGRGALVGGILAGIGVLLIGGVFGAIKLVAVAREQWKTSTWSTGGYADSTGNQQHASSGSSSWFSLGNDSNPKAEVEKSARQCAACMRDAVDAFCSIHDRASSLAAEQRMKASMDGYLAALKRVVDKGFDNVPLDPQLQAQITREMAGLAHRMREETPRIKFLAIALRFEDVFDRIVNMMTTHIAQLEQMQRTRSQSRHGQ